MPKSLGQRLRSRNLQIANPNRDFTGQCTIPTLPKPSENLLTLVRWKEERVRSDTITAPCLKLWLDDESREWSNAERPDKRRPIRSLRSVPGFHLVDFSRQDSIYTNICSTRVMYLALHLIQHAQRQPTKYRPILHSIALTSSIRILAGRERAREYRFSRAWLACSHFCDVAHVRHSDSPSSIQDVKGRVYRIGERLRRVI